MFSRFPMVWLHRWDASSFLVAASCPNALARQKMRVALPKPHTPLDHPARIFLVDDQEVVRRGLASLFGTEPDLRVCGEAARAAEAMSKMAKLRPDLAVVDLVLAEGEAFDLISELRQKLPALKILVFSIYREPAYVVRAMRAGADDYVTKDEGAEEVIHAIRELMRQQPARE